MGANKLCATRFVCRQLGSAAAAGTGGVPFQLRAVRLEESAGQGRGWAAQRWSAAAVTKRLLVAGGLGHLQQSQMAHKAPSAFIASSPCLYAPCLLQGAWGGKRGGKRGRADGSGGEEEEDGRKPENVYLILKGGRQKSAEYRCVVIS